MPKIFILFTLDQRIHTFISRMKRVQNLRWPLRRIQLLLLLVTLLLFCSSMKTCLPMAVYRRIYPWRSMDLSTSNPQSDKIDAQTTTESHDEMQGYKKKDEVSQYSCKVN